MVVGDVCPPLAPLELDNDLLDGQLRRLGQQVGDQKLAPTESGTSALRPQCFGRDCELAGDMTHHDAFAVRPGSRSLNGGCEFLKGGRVGSPGQTNPKYHY